jgi:hypothetical protein
MVILKLSGFMLALPTFLTNCPRLEKFKLQFFLNQLSKCCHVGISHWLFDSYLIGNVKCQLYVSHFDVKALALLKVQLHLNKNTKSNEFPKTRI